MGVPVFSKKVLWPASIVTVLALGAFLGAFIEYARGIDHPVSNSPIKVEYCYLFAHEHLFRGQLVETEAQYTQEIEGAVIGEDACPDYDSPYYGPTEHNSVLSAWETDLFKNWYAAKFNLTFIGVIPSYPRYQHWIADAKNHGQRIHRVRFIQLIRITHFERLQ